MIKTMKKLPLLFLFLIAVSSFMSAIDLKTFINMLNKDNEVPFKKYESHRHGGRFNDYWSDEPEMCTFDGIEKFELNPNNDTIYLLYFFEGYDGSSGKLQNLNIWNKHSNITFDIYYNETYLDSMFFPKWGKELAENWDIDSLEKLSHESSIIPTPLIELYRFIVNDSSVSYDKAWFFLPNAPDSFPTEWWCNSEYIYFKRKPYNIK